MIAGPAREEPVERKRCTHATQMKKMYQELHISFSANQSGLSVQIYVPCRVPHVKDEPDRYLPISWENTGIILCSKVNTSEERITL